MKLSEMSEKGRAIPKSRDIGFILQKVWASRELKGAFPNTEH